MQPSQDGAIRPPIARKLTSSLPAAILVLSGIAGCTTGQPAGPGEFNDPYEQTNRRIHNFNTAVDRAVYRPVSNAYGTVLPQPVRRGVDNFSEFTDLPRRIVNDILQGKAEDALHNSFRFATNATFGLLGVLDPATSLGVESRDADFGETLHVWGVGEGAYLAVPFFGPSTQRDLAGDIVDLVTNPLGYVLSPPESYAPPGSTVGEYANYRYTYRDTLNDVLDNSADSYATTRVIFLDARRFELGMSPGSGGADDGGVIDPYEELYGE
ncbi:VacJ family lipoprotein [Poseidonocella sp. HB161398]|uniref:MlaA family lipoprotein n=1 Tax=Poseidonocella sp. HB161398 TaxID=2320855 RepID=UPI0014869D2D|nr:VacJ family lipoprotein [Poseidonocella sp. HB161398]